MTADERAPAPGSGPPLGRARAGRVAVETDPALREPPGVADARIAIGVASPVVGPTIGHDEEVGVADGAFVALERHLVARDVVADERARRRDAHPAGRFEEKPSNRGRPEDAAA